MIRHLRAPLAAALLCAAAATPAWADGNEDNLACYEEFKEGGDERLAIYYCSRAIESGDLADADLITALLNRGVAHKMSGNLKMAVIDYTSALKLSPDDALILANRANAYRELGELDKALSDIDRALSLAPERAASYYVRGAIYEAQGQGAKAAQDFAKAYELDPENTDYKSKAGAQ